MTHPDKQVLLDWARNHPELWNTGDKRALTDSWRTLATGEFRMLDPVCTPEKRGFKSFRHNS